MRPRFIQSWSHVSRTRSGGRQRQKEDGFSFRKPGRLSETSSSLAEKHARCIRWVASGGTRRRAKRRRSFSDLGINCKLVYRPQRTLGCWFIRRVVAAFASSSPSSLRSPFNSGSPVPSRPSNSRAWPTTKHPPFANGNCRKFHRILPRLVFYRTSFNKERRDKRPLFLSIPSILHEKGKDPIPPPRKDSLTTIQNCRFRGRFPSKGKSYAHADKFRGIARKERKGGGKEEGREREGGR